MTANIKNDVIFGVIREMAWTKELQLSKIDSYVYQLSKIYDSNNTPVIKIVIIDDLITIIQKLPQFNKFFMSGSTLPPPLSTIYKKKFIKGDGNCLFHCLRYLNIWKSNTHQEIRDIICIYLREMIEELENTYYDEHAPPEDPNSSPKDEKPNLFILLQEEEMLNADQYIKYMCTSAEWGTYIEILTAIYITHQNINVYRRNYEGNGQIHEYFDSIKNFLRKKNKIFIDDTLPTINLFNNTTHYEILMPIDLSLQMINEPGKKVLTFSPTRVSKKSKDFLNNEPEDIQEILIYTLNSLEDLHKISSKPKAPYICIPNLNGNFQSLIKCHVDTNDFKYKYLKYKMKYLNLKLQKSS